VEAVFREVLRSAGLPAQGALPRLLALLRASPETHLTLAEIAELAAKSGLALTQAELAHQLELLTGHGLVGRLPTTGAEVVFDTIAEPHAHLVYEEFDEVVDLHVSHETLLAMIRDALAQRPDGVEVLIRFRRDAGAPAG
jgi:Fur family iron response transcriptional regulator